MHLLRTCLFFFTAMASSLMAGEEPTHRLEPRVLEMAAPRYPPMAKLSNIYGVVHFLVQTDGYVIKEILKSDGPPMLVKELGKFLKTWKFEHHTPVQFEITFDMKTSGPAILPPGKPDEIKLILPSFVEMICTRIL